MLIVLFFNKKQYFCSNKIKQIMDKSTPLSLLMTKKVIVADLHTKFTDILTLFLDYKIYHLPVVFDNKLLGIISLTDALHFFQKHANEITKDDHLNEKFNMEETMTHNPKTLNINDTLKDATELLSSAKFRAVPIVNDHGEIQGIISNKDLVKILNKIL